MGAPMFQLRSLPTSIRLSLSFLVLTLIGGYAASGAHMHEHHENRDEREGLSMVDLEGAYHGVTSISPLTIALESGHPSELEGQSAPEPYVTEALLNWLKGDPKQIVPNWDNLDLGDLVPADLLDASCVTCHSRTASEEVRAEPPLEYIDDIRAVAFSREISPADMKILIASTHTHAIALGTVTLIVIAMMLFTRCSSRTKGWLSLAASGGLLLDLAAWWLARESSAWVMAVIAGGTAHALGIVLMCLLILMDLWKPMGTSD